MNGQMDALEKYLDTSRRLGKSEETIKSRKFLIRNFYKRCEGKDFMDMLSDSEAIMNFIEGTPPQELSETTKSLRYTVLKAFFKFLETEGVIGSNVFETKIPFRRKLKLLPSKIGSEKDVEKMLEIKGVLNKKGSHVIRQTPFLLHRDRMIMEVCYTCSLRRSEAISLLVSSLDHDLKALYVKGAKNRKNRLVPLGEKVFQKLLAYLQEMKDFFSAKKQVEFQLLPLFPSKAGTHLHPNHVTIITKEFKGLAKLKIDFTSHSFRKSSATHMLKAGAPIESVQVMLGHKRLSSSEVYTKVYPSNLIMFIRKYHPLEREKGMIMPRLETPEYKTQKLKIASKCKEGLPAGLALAPQVSH